MSSIVRYCTRVTACRSGLILASCVALALGGTFASAQTYRLLEEQANAERARILRSLINSSGYPCSVVTTILFRGADDDQAGYWAVACSDGGNWQVQVKNDAGGSSSVASCEVLRAVKIDCWQRF